MAIINEKGLKYAKLIHVSVDNGKTDNSNKFYIMEEQSDGKIRCEYGRVGKAGTVVYKNIGEWNKLIREKTTKKGYHDVTDLISDVVIENKTENKNSLLENIKDRGVKDVIEKLMAFANNSIKQNYTVSQEAVTIKQVEEATKLVDEIIGLVKIGVDTNVVNKLLLNLYSVIPRKMDNVKNYLISEIKDDSDLQKALQKINDEKSTLDTMSGQVKLLAQQKDQNNDSEGDNKNNTSNITILDQMGVDMVEETDSEVIETVKTLLEEHAGKLSRVFRVVNHKTQEAFDKQVANSDNKKIRLYWHGSRNQNWFNITQTGLMIRPSGAGYNGSMFGDGIYFAKEADKSMGYTDGGRWTRNGKQNLIYMALFQVHLGKQYVVNQHDSGCYSLSANTLKNKGNYDSTHAKKGRSLYRDEFIIYQKEQCTIKYLVELKN